MTWNAHANGTNEINFAGGNVSDSWTWVMNQKFSKEKTEFFFPFSFFSI